MRRTTKPMIEKPQRTPRAMTASESLVTVQPGLIPATIGLVVVVAAGSEVVDVVQSSSP